MPVSMSDLLLALDFVSSDGGGMNEAFLCRQTGKIHWRSSDLDDQFEELPDDLEESDNYIAYLRNGSWTSASHWCSPLPASSCPTTMTKFTESLVAEVLTAISRCYWRKRVNSTNGIISRRRPPNEHCAIGAKNIRSRSPTRIGLCPFDKGHATSKSRADIQPRPR